MAITFIIKKSIDELKPKTRSELEERLRGDGMSFMKDEELDKQKWAEKKVGIRKR